MAESTQQISGSSHSEQVAHAARNKERTEEIKARREKINNDQEEKHSDLKRTVEKNRDISDFSDSSRVKISRALTNFLSESHPKEITHEQAQNPLDGKTVEKEPQQGKHASEPSSDPFFQRLASIHSADLPTAKDKLQGNTQPKPTTHKIDVFG
ncbi:MAG: hypothetical protein HQL70_02250 [Magnetococcales bacterium]|nr:hypothetical protein [Magnetococcales bacterium]